MVEAPGCCLTIALFKASLETTDEVMVNVTIGLGVLGMGGATGEGIAANAGYQGNPGTDMEAVSWSHASPNPVATLCESFNPVGFFGLCARISGAHGGPTTLPPEAVTPLTTTPIKVADDC